MISRRDFPALVAAANRAPSVHNIQPTRFKLEDERTIALIEDPQRRLFVGDPEGKDNQKSMGCALEGLALALSERGIGVEVSPAAAGEPVRAKLVSGAAPDPLAPFAESRQTYRGVFAPKSRDSVAALSNIAQTCPDLHIIEDPGAIADLAKLYDRVSLEVIRNPAYRAELLSWLRLSSRSPHYHLDGLNAEHMALSRFEAAAAGIVLGRAFPALDAIGLAGSLMTEAPRVKSAAAVALFHRPALEPELETGRRFYRVWLQIEHGGLSLCPMSVLADVPRVATQLLHQAGLGPDRKLVTAFRIGLRPQRNLASPRARLPTGEIILE